MWLVVKIIYARMYMIEFKLVLVLYRVRQRRAPPLFFSIVCIYFLHKLDLLIMSEPK